MKADVFEKLGPINQMLNLFVLQSLSKCIVASAREAIIKINIQLHQHKYYCCRFSPSNGTRRLLASCPIKEQVVCQIKIGLDPETKEPPFLT